MRLFRKKKKPVVLNENRFKDMLASGEPIAYRGIMVPVSADIMPEPVVIALVHDDYEVPELNAATNLLSDGDRVLELGAGLGIISGALGKAFPECEFLSFEANPKLIPHISKLQEANGITNVTVRNRLLEPNPQVASRSFHLHEYFTESSITQTDRTQETVEVPVEDLNAVIADFQPTVIMCDIEGAEEMVLPAADLSGVRALILELHPKVMSRAGVKAIFDTCASFGLYPRVEYSAQQVVAFEKVD
jgi:FkbM family methyltransferase